MKNIKIITPKVVFAGVLALLTGSFPVFGAPTFAPPATEGQIPSIQANSLLALASPQNPVRVIDRTLALITAYASTPDQTDDTPFITAYGTKVREGIVAANFLPFGTRIKIPALYGDQIFVVEDRMNPRKGYQIDIWFPSSASAKDFGVRYTDIEILGS